MRVEDLELRLIQILSRRLTRKLRDNREAEATGSREGALCPKCASERVTHMASTTTWSSMCLACSHVWSDEDDDYAAKAAAEKAGVEGMGVSRIPGHTYGDDRASIYIEVNLPGGRVASARRYVGSGGRMFPKIYAALQDELIVIVGQVANMLRRNEE